MKTYTAKEAKNRLGEVFRAALEAPVVITVHGKPSVRIVANSMSSEDIKSPRNRHAVLDSIKHKISCEILARFPLSEIKKRSRENLSRWRLQGTDGPAYDDWRLIIDDEDDTKMIAAMVGTNERSNQLRQSPPYVGMLDQTIVRKFNEEIAG